ncbi:MAG: patatin-like phospholipase family protein [Thermodesulfobacteriota bacterium]
MTEKQTKTVSLVLGSGGARGLAHIGVIRWLEENGYVIRSISGCSMGALVGGIYAAGKLDAYEAWVRTVTKRDIVGLLDIAWGGGGLVKGDRIIHTMVDLVGDVAIEDLPIPYTAVAVDLKNEKEVWIQSGPLFDAIRASISLPLFFTPFRVDGVPLIDGGVLNPVPIAPTFGDRTDMTIAVNLDGPATKEIRPPAVPAEPRQASAFVEAVSRFFKKFQKNGETGPEPEEETDQDWSAYDIATQAFDAMQGTIARLKLAAYPPSRVIDIPKNACGLLEFNRAAEMIEMGYRAAKERLTSLTDPAVENAGTAGETQKPVETVKTPEDDKELK